MRTLSCTAIILAATAAPPALAAPINAFAASTGSESDRVIVWDVRGVVTHDFKAYGGFQGGVNVAVADVNGDGTADVITGAGRGAGGGHVKVFDGRTGAVHFDFLAYEEAFTGGVRVAAGDVNRDGKADVAVLAGPGGGGRVRVFSGADGVVLHDFSAFETSELGDETDVAVGDVDGDGIGDVTVGTGKRDPASGAYGHVRSFSGADGSVLDDFFAYDAAAVIGGGISISVGDLNGDGVGEILTASGPGEPSVIHHFDLTNPSPRVLLLLPAIQKVRAAATEAGLFVGIAGDASASHGSGGGAGKVSYQDLHFTAAGAPVLGRSIEFTPFGTDFTGEVEVAAFRSLRVPAPAAGALMLFGLGAFAGLRRRQGR